MSWENQAGSNPITLPLASTGIRSHRFVVLDSTGGCDYPDASTVGGSVSGVLVSSGTTGSTDASSAYGAIQTAGVALVEAESSTLAAGALVSASSVGRAQPATNAGDFVVGRIVAGSSGGANRQVSVLLQPLGSTVAAV